MQTNARKLELTLTGAVPSKKNSRINTSSGRSFPSKDYSDWHKETLKSLNIRRPQHFLKPVALEVIIYFGTKHRADLDNKVTSIQDLLVDAMILRDDGWQDVPRIAVEAVYRKGKPGAFVRITELEDIA